ncbi:hypothetical protein M3Y95_00870400 [Aphelenchoides besseyi]|nr:hypothetical protein M3Y95_00870400 [Aphelenchoides besseyi]
MFPMSSVAEDKIERVLRFRIRIVARNKKEEVVRELPPSPTTSTVQSDWNASSGRSSLNDAQLNNEHLINKTEQLLKTIRSKYQTEVARTKDVKLSKRCVCNCTICGRGSLPIVSATSSPTSMNSNSRVQTLEERSFISATSSSKDNSAVRDSFGRKLHSRNVDDHLPHWIIRERDPIQYVESTGSTQSENEDAFGSPLTVQSIRSSYGHRMITPVRYKKR